MSESQTKALRLVKDRRYCAYWLIPKRTLRALLRKRLIVPCGFYSVCLPEHQATFPVKISYANPERAFDEVSR